MLDETLIIFIFSLFKSKYHEKTLISEKNVFVILLSQLKSLSINAT